MSAPMRMPISGIYKIKGVGDVLAGAWPFFLKRNEDGSPLNQRLFFRPLFLVPCFFLRVGENPLEDVWSRAW